MSNLKFINLCIHPVFFLIPHSLFLLLLKPAWSSIPSWEINATEMSCSSAENASTASCHLKQRKYNRLLMVLLNHDSYVLSTYQSSIVFRMDCSDPSSLDFASSSADINHLLFFACIVQILNCSTLFNMKQTSIIYCFWLHCSNPSTLFDIM